MNNKIIISILIIVIVILLGAIVSLTIENNFGNNNPDNILTVGDLHLNLTGFKLIN